MGSPEAFVKYWKYEYKQIIRHFESWKGYSSYLTALSKPEKFKYLAQPSPSISQFFDIYYGRIDEHFIKAWKQKLELKNIKTIDDVALQMTTGDWEKIDECGYSKTLLRLAQEWIEIKKTAPTAAYGYDLLVTAGGNVYDNGTPIFRI
jgi:hypothetical protein